MQSHVELMMHVATNSIADLQSQDTWQLVVNSTTGGQAASVWPPPFQAASAQLSRLAGSQMLSAERVEHARDVLRRLAIWEAPEPTSMTDGSDGELGLIWRRGSLVASLTVDEDDVLGYAYSPDMQTPWTFEADRIGVPELNRLVRALSSAVA